jgi:hypothetical protein
MLLIPTPSATYPHFRQTTELDGKTYGLEFYWNTRDLAWYLSIWDSAFESRLLAARKLAVGAQVLGRIPRDAGLPPGEIMAQDLSGTNAEPGMKDLGLRVVVAYWLQTELL